MPIDAFSTLTQDAELQEVISALALASHQIHQRVMNEDGLVSAGQKNESGDTQIGLDVVADGLFREALTRVSSVAYVVSEEQPELVRLSGKRFGVALDPLDGSKSARLGIPSGSIFAIFENISGIQDFNGGNIVASGFFIYGIQHEVFAACGRNVLRAREVQLQGSWKPFPLPSSLPSAGMISINSSNFGHWEKWLQDYYSSIFDVADSSKKPWNMRWYASLVSEVKRLILEGGVFAYPGDSRPGYKDGHLRLVYEALPMAYLIKALGGTATDGEAEILSKSISALHQKTPLFLGEPRKIEQLLDLRNKWVDLKQKEH